MANEAIGLPAPIHDLTATAMAPAAALSDRDGQIRTVGMQGLFWSDTRVLSRALMRFNDTEPQTLARFAEGPGRTRFVGFAHGFGDPTADPTVRIDRIRTLDGEGMTEEIRLRSSAAVPVSGVLSVELACELTSLESAKVTHPGPGLAAQELGPDGLVWTDARTTVSVRAPGARVSVAPARLSWTVDLPPTAEMTLEWNLRCAELRPIVVSPEAAVEWSRPDVHADEARLARLLAQSLDDLVALRLAEPGDGASTFIAAGVPWFLTLFGRDSLWAARMLLPLGTDLAHGTLRVLARRQGRRLDPPSGEEPGKIMHELRRDDIWLRSATVSPVAYYGTIDATPLWIGLLAEAWRWGLPDAAVEAFLPNLRAALSWLDTYADPDGDGLVKYLDRSGRGLANQGWKDSGGAIRFHNGSMAEPPIALCEVQGYAHRAAVDAVAILEAFDGPPAEVERWRAYAATLRDRFRDRFWVSGPLGDHPALALDRHGRPVDSLTSNIGHLLGTGLLDPDEEARVATLLDSEPMSSGYGLRTMSTLDTAYSPLSYHCGSVWPHDTAIALGGLSTAAADGTMAAEVAARNLLRGLLDAAESFDYRLPELYGGDAKSTTGGPVPHPGACRPHAWSAAAGVALLGTALGLDVDLPRGRVRVRPLPGLGSIDARGLRIGQHPVDVHVDGHGRATVRGLPEPVRSAAAGTAFGPGPDH